MASSTVDQSTGELVITSEDVDNAVTAVIAGMNAGNKSIFSTLDGGSEEDQDLVFNAITNSEPIDDHLGETINLVHFVAQEVKILDSATNEEVTVARTVLLDADGSAYHAISGPLLLSLRNLIEIYGKPADWKSPKAIAISKEKGKRGSFFRMTKVNTTTSAKK